MRGPCTGRQILNHCATREAQVLALLALNVADSWMSPAVWREDGEREFRKEGTASVKPLSEEKVVGQLEGGSEGR